jgi:hypothetical protein
VTGSVYESERYVTASAEHVGASVETVEAGGAVLPLLRYADSSLRTVYGLPRPSGVDDSDALSALGDRLAVPGVALTAVLSPLEPGPRLAAMLRDRGARITGRRPICIAELGDTDPSESFDSRARRAIRTARKRGASTTVAAVAPWFGAFYRAAMEQLSAEQIYLFSDRYFEALASLPHFQLTVEDEHGPAAAALFLHDGREAYYHLGGRRCDPEPVVGAMSLALGEGVCEAWRRGCRLAVLGGGRTDNADDSLLVFKRQLAPSLRDRVSVELGTEGR